MPIDEQTIARLDSHYMKQYNAYIERRKKRKKGLIRRLILFSVVILTITGIMTGYHIKQRILHAEMNEKLVQLEQQFASLTEEEMNLREEISLLNNDDYVLQIARTNYFFSKEGELIFKITGEKPSY